MTRRANVDWYLSASADDPVLIAKLERALASLRRWDREVFLASRVDQLTYAEIAERYGMSERAVQRRVIRAYHEVVRYVADDPVIPSRRVRKGTFSASAP